MRTCTICDSFIDSRAMSMFFSCKNMCAHCEGKFTQEAKRISHAIQKFKEASGLSYQTFVEFGKERPDV